MNIEINVIDGNETIKVSVSYSNPNYNSRLPKEVVEDYLNNYIHKKVLDVMGDLSMAESLHILKDFSDLDRISMLGKVKLLNYYENGGE